MTKETPEPLFEPSLTPLDIIRARCKAIGVFLTTVAYSLCHEVVSWLPILKQHATPVTCILVGGFAGAVVLLYERNFLGKVISPEQQTQFPPMQFPPQSGTFPQQQSPVFPPPTFPASSNSNPNQ